MILLKEYYPRNKFCEFIFSNVENNAIVIVYQKLFQS